MGNEHHTRIAGYEGPAELVWGSWVIEGQACIRERSCEEAPFGLSDRVSMFREETEAGALVGAFTANSGTEPMLLSSLARALGEIYRLRWTHAGHSEDLPVAVTARHGNRVHFETRE